MVIKTKAASTSDKSLVAKASDLLSAETNPQCQEMSPQQGSEVYEVAISPSQTQKQTTIEECEERQRLAAPNVQETGKDLEHERRPRAEIEAHSRWQSQRILELERELATLKTNASDISTMLLEKQRVQDELNVEKSENEKLRKSNTKLRTKIAEQGHAHSAHVMMIQGGQQTIAQLNGQMAQMHMDFKQLDEIRETDHQEHIAQVQERCQDAMHHVISGIRAEHTVEIARIRAEFACERSKLLNGIAVEEGERYKRIGAGANEGSDASWRAVSWRARKMRLEADLETSEWLCSGLP